MAKKRRVRRVFHLLHLRGQVFQMVSGTKEEPRMTLYSVLCDEDIRVTRQVQNNLIPDCGLKFGINRMSKVHTFDDMIGQKTELYAVIVDVGNSVRSRVTIDDYIGKWSTIKNLVTPENNKTIEWVSNLKLKGAWSIVDYLAGDDERFKKIIENNLVVDPI